MKKKSKKNKIIIGSIIVIIVLLFILWFITPFFINGRVTYKEPIQKVLCKLRPPCEVKMDSIYCTESLREHRPTVNADIMNIPEHKESCHNSSYKFKETNQKTRDKIYVVNIEICDCIAMPFFYQ